LVILLILIRSQYGRSCRSDSFRNKNLTCKSEKRQRIDLTRLRSYPAILSNLQKLISRPRAYYITISFRSKNIYTRFCTRRRGQNGKGPREGWILLRECKQIFIRSHRARERERKWKKNDCLRKLSI
jgi:hypothetical protein